MLKKSRIIDFSPNDLKLLLELLKKNQNKRLCYENIEIIRKYISAKSLFLKKDLKKIFKNLYGDYLNFFNLIFMEVVSKKIFRNKEGFIDISIINSILSLKNNTNKTYIFHKNVNNQLKKLKFYLISIKKKFEKKKNFEEFKFNYQILKKESSQARSIVILSPSPYSLYTGCVVQLCKHFSIPVEAIIIRKFSINRFFEETRRDGYLYLFRKIFNKLILNGNDNISHSEVSLKYVFNKLKIPNKNIKDVAKDENIKILEVDNFKILNKSFISLRSKIALFTGGGIISKDIIGNFHYGIINLHVGNLPKYKGMDTTEASILEGNFNSLALTTHLMEHKVDSGPILTKYIFSSEGYEKIGIMFNEISSLFPFMLVDAYLGLISKRYKKINQKKEGKLYFTLNKELKKLAEYVLLIRSKKNNKPVETKNFVNEILKNFI